MSFEIQRLFVFLLIIMRYHYEKPTLYSQMYGETYKCDHPVYTYCTLYRIENKGLAVIMQRYREEDKSTYWSELDPSLVDVLYLNENFKKLFDERAGLPVDGLYPTITVRQLMWALKMKPLPKQRWETAFDRKDI